MNYRPIDSFYDIETLDNLFTLSIYRPEKNKLVIAGLQADQNGDVSDLKLTDQQIQDIKARIVEVNELDFKNDTEIEIQPNLDAFFMYQLFPLIHRHLNKEIQNKADLHIQTRNPNQSWIKPIKGGYDNIVSHVFEGPRAGFYFGFNSKTYDTVMLAYVASLWIDGTLAKQDSELTNANGPYSDLFTPKDIKQFSNALIEVYKGSAWKALANESQAKSIWQAMNSSKRFVDVRALTGKSAALTMSLKRYAAQAGWMILESEVVQDSASELPLPDQTNDANPLAELLAYNVSDVFKTMHLFEQKDWQTGFNQHMSLIERFHDDLNPETNVDTTNSNFITDVIVPFKPDNKRHFGEDPNNRLEDAHTINFDFPILQTNGEYKDQDLLEVAKQAGLPQEAYEFYATYRGATNVEAGKKAVMDKANDVNSVLHKANLSDSGTTVTVWVPNGDGTFNDSYNTLSVGGAHGEYARYREYELALTQHNQLIKDSQLLADTYNSADDETKKALIEAYKNNESFGQIKTGLHDLASTVNSKRVNLKTIKDIKHDPKEYAATVNAQNVIHADVDSLYPTLLTILKTFLKGETDIYGLLRNERLKLKASLPEDKSTWTAKDEFNNLVQLLNKLLLNSATGAADANFETKLKVSNKITSMRMIGNLLIMTLAMNLAKIGGTLVSINTDGLYTFGITETQADEVIDAWKKQFNLSASPELVERFVSKDSNNRLEVGFGGKLQYAGGATFSHRGKPSLAKSAAHAGIIDDALVEYLWKSDRPLDSLDTSDLITYFQSRIDDASDDLNKRKAVLLQFQWLLTSSASKNRYFMQHTPEHNDYKKLGTNVRTFLVDENKRTDAVGIKLLAINKTVATTEPIFVAAAKYAQSKQENTSKEIAEFNGINEALSMLDIHPRLETGLSLITDEQVWVDEFINKIKAVPAKQYEDALDMYEDMQSEIDLFLKRANLNSSASKNKILRDGQSVVEFKKSLVDGYNSNFRGTTSSIVRPAFISAPNMTSDMRFVIDNRDLTYIAQTNLINELDLMTYAKLAISTWETWAEKHSNLKFNLETQIQSVEDADLKFG